jgi:hypothetical protein
MYGGVGGEVSNGLPYPMNIHGADRRPELSWKRKLLTTGFLRNFPQSMIANG